MMLTIYIGDADREVKVDSYAPEQCLMPKDVAKHFRGWVKAGEDQSVRTFTSTIPNLVGEMIDLEAFPFEQVRLVTDIGEHTLDSHGIVSADWPYGIFNYA